MIVASIRNDEQSFLCVVCSFHLAQAEIDSIKQGRQTMSRRVHQSILHFFDAGRERTYELSPVVEVDQEEFILRVGGAEELHGSDPRFVDLIRHAATHIENDTD